MNRKNLGHKIQLAREEKKMSQGQLAGAIGCSQAALSNYEKGKRRIYLSQLEKLAEVLDKPFDYFMTSVDDKVPPAVKPLPSDKAILRLVTGLYELTPEEIDEVENYIKYLRWKREEAW
jgi:transcriptional regulator with XRE-family HTH domain